jgi:hypothetical protein
MTHVCPKCYGDTELILTNRDNDGWLIGAMRRMTCDYCEGIGTVTAARAQRVYEVVNHPTQPPILAPVLTQAAMCTSWAKNAFETTSQPVPERDKWGVQKP